MTRPNLKYAGPAAAVLALAAGLGGLWGCESDAVAPQDSVPVLTEEDSAMQAGLVAFAVAEMAPQAVQFSDKAEYHYFFTHPEGEAGASGDIVLDYRMGSADGLSATYDMGTWVHIYTGDPEGLIIETPLGGRIYIECDLMAAITRGTPDSAVVLDGSGGQLTAGSYAATFTVQDLTVSTSGYPSGGPLAFDNGTHVLSLMFDGSSYVKISLNGTERWTFDLEDLVLADII